MLVKVLLVSLSSIFFCIRLQDQGINNNAAYTEPLALLLHIYIISSPMATDGGVMLQRADCSHISLRLPCSRVHPGGTWVKL